jgi:hypothetical protein
MLAILASRVIQGTLAYSGIHVHFQDDSTEILDVSQPHWRIADNHLLPSIKRVISLGLSSAEADTDA